MLIWRYSLGCSIGVQHLTDYKVGTKELAFSVRQMDITCLMPLNLLIFATKLV